MKRKLVTYFMILMMVVGLFSMTSLNKLVAVNAETDVTTNETTATKSMVVEVSEDTFIEHRNDGVSENQNFNGVEKSNKKYIEIKGAEANGKAPNRIAGESAAYLELEEIGQSSIKPIEDTYVQVGSNADNSFGDKKELNIKGDPNGKNYRIGYLKFDFSDVDYVKDAKMKLYVSGMEAGKDSYTLRFVGFENNDWDESVTWNTAPDKNWNDRLAQSSVTEFGPLEKDIAELKSNAETNQIISGEWITVDVTDFVNSQLMQGKTIISFKIYDPDHNNAFVKLHSKENKNSPILEFTEVERPISSDADLEDLSFDMGTLTPEFDKNATDYTLSVYNTTEKVTVTPIVSNQNSILEINGEKVESGRPHEINLQSENTSVVITVTAEDGTQKTYTISISKSEMDPSILDLNGNGIIEVGDLAYIAARYESTADAKNWDPKADLNGDGIVNDIDIEIITKFIVEKDNPSK